MEGSQRGERQWFRQRAGRAQEGPSTMCVTGGLARVERKVAWRRSRADLLPPPIRKLVEGIVRSKRAKKRLVAGAARRLAIDLWRLATGQTTAEKMSLVMPYS